MRHLGSFLEPLNSLYEIIIKQFLASLKPKSRVSMLILFASSLGLLIGCGLKLRATMVGFGFFRDDSIEMVVSYTHPQFILAEVNDNRRSPWTLTVV